MDPAEGFQMRGCGLYWRNPRKVANLLAFSFYEPQKMNRVQLMLRGSCICSFAVALFCIALAPSATEAAGELAPAVLERIKQSTVFIKTTAADGEGRGSGFFIRKNMVVTNAHVVGISAANPNPPSRIEIVLNSGAGGERAIPATMLAADTTADLAFLQVANQPQIDPLEILPSAQVRETLPVYIVGFPLGEALDGYARNPAVTIATGIVSSLRRSAYGDVEEIQIDGSIIPGNSGGPIIDSKGRLVAVSVATILGLNIGFSIPGDVVESDLNGRIQSASLTHITHSDGVYGAKASVKTVDPLKNIRAVAIYYWISPKGTQRPLDPKAKVETHGAPGDGPRQHIRLQFDQAAQAWVGEIKRYELRADQDIWIQPAIATASGVSLVGAINHSADMRARVTGEPFATPRGRSRRNSPPAPRPQVTKPEPQNPVQQNPIQAKLAERFRRTKPRRTVEPVGPGPMDPLEAKLERDQYGRPYSLVETQAETLTMGDTKLLQMVSAPNGEFVYAVFSDRASVAVFDTRDMLLLKEIPVARYPIGLWCDTERLVVACNESRLISFIDLASGQITRSVRIDNREMRPIRICGEAPDGSMITLWQDPATSSVDHLYLVEESGDSLEVAKGDFDWCVFPDGANFLWQHSTFRNSPSGAGSVFPLGDPNQRVDLRRDAFGKRGLSLHRDCGHSFLTSDGKHFILPIEAREMEPMTPYGTMTLVLRPDLSEIVMDLPGSVVAESPTGEYFVAWRNTPGVVGLARPQVLYVSRSTGRIIRQINVNGYEPHPGCFPIRNATPNIIYVPGRELFLVHDNNAQDATVTMIRCGPIVSDALVPADPTIVSENLPPRVAYIGKAMAYAPSFTRPADADSIVFRIKQGVPGMEIDPSTGRISFTPTDANLGLYDVVIVADIDGIEVPVLKWLLEIDYPGDGNG